MLKLCGQHCKLHWVRFVFFFFWRSNFKCYFYSAYQLCCKRGIGLCLSVCPSVKLWYTIMRFRQTLGQRRCGHSKSIIPSETILYGYPAVRGGRVVRCRTCELRPRGRGFESHQRLLCTNAISACHPSGDRLMSTSESWGVNGHTTRCAGPVSVVLRLRLVSGWRLWNGD